jgi:MarR family transcriptional regulator, temperature-dependent positive regulator of motility
MASTSEKSLLHLLHRAVQVGTDRFAKELGDSGLTARQLVVLKTIVANDGASQTGVVDITGIDRSTLADIVQRLLKRRLISRKRTKEDARAYALTLTEEGRRAVAMAEPILRTVERDMLAVIPAKQRSEWLETLRTIAAAT